MFAGKLQLFVKSENIIQIPPRREKHKGMIKFTQNDYKYAQKFAFCVIMLLAKILLLADFIICLLQSIFNNISVLSSHISDFPSLIPFNLIV